LREKNFYRRFFLLIDGRIIVKRIKVRGTPMEESNNNRDCVKIKYKSNSRISLYVKKKGWLEMCNNKKEDERWRNEVKIILDGIFF